MNIITTTIYGASALAFLALTLLSLTSWGGRQIGIRIILASALSSLWAAVPAMHAWSGGVPLLVVYATEICRDAAWIWVLTGVAGTSVPPLLRRGAMTACAVLLAIAVAWPWLQRYDWLPDRKSVGEGK